MTVEVVRKRKTVSVTKKNTDVIQVSDPGAAGPPNALTIGTVTSGPLAVSLTGTSPTQVLNFTFPVGEVTYYQHTQSAASATWTITHNLGYYPAGVAVVDSGGSTCLGDVTYLSLNALMVNFAAAFSGSAYLS
jgi:hypothetical protein